jgi:hypothetical protein
MLNPIVYWNLLHPRFEHCFVEQCFESLVEEEITRLQAAEPSSDAVSLDDLADTVETSLVLPLQRTAVSMYTCAQSEEVPHDTTRCMFVICHIIP